MQFNAAPFFLMSLSTMVAPSASLYCMDSQGEETLVASSDYAELAVSIESQDKGE